MATFLPRTLAEAFEYPPRDSPVGVSEGERIEFLTQLQRLSDINLDRYKRVNLPLRRDNYRDVLTPGKVKANEIFCALLQEAIKLQKTILPSQMFIIELDGPEMRTARYIGEMLPELPRENIIVPNSSDSFRKMVVQRQATVLFAPFGGQDTTYSGTDLFPLTDYRFFAGKHVIGVWLDFCGGLYRRHREVDNAFYKLHFLHGSIFAITVSVRKSQGWNGGALVVDYITSLCACTGPTKLSRYQARLIRRSGNPTMPTFYFEITIQQIPPEKTCSFEWPEHTKVPEKAPPIIRHLKRKSKGFRRRAKVL